MELLSFFKQVISRFEKFGVRYALAGGLIASVYREQKRLTMDLDFLILADANTQKIATEIITSFGLTAGLARKADLEGGPLFARKNKSTEVMMLIGRNKTDPNQIGLDLILPTIPWFAEALARSQENIIDFGFGGICCLTAEDVIVAKLLAFKNNPTRFNDLDDLQSIFAANHDLDLSYLYARMKKLGLKIPGAIKKSAPKILSAI